MATTKSVEYVQLRRTSEMDWDTFWYRSDARRKEMVQRIADGLFQAWFPNHKPEGEDLENWTDIAYSDAEVAVLELIRGGWLDDN
jgi:hypothetical protein